MNYDRGHPMAPGKMIQQFTIERLGRVQTWTLRSEPFGQHRNLRRAYVRGFTQRTEDFNQGIHLGEVDAERLVPASKVVTVGDAHALGYADAMKQERP